MLLICNNATINLLLLSIFYFNLMKVNLIGRVTKCYLRNIVQVPALRVRLYIVLIRYELHDMGVD